MEMNAKIHGLEDALKAMEAAFPKNADKARSLLNQTMSGSARKSILPMAKVLALVGDGSGALSESLAPRAVGKTRAAQAGHAARIQITPVRYNKKAIAMYSAFYYKKSVGLGRVAEGIRHGHLVEFGHKDRNGNHVAAKPFLYPALKAGKSAYIGLFAAIMKNKIAAAVRHRAKKAKKAKR